MIILYCIIYLFTLQVSRVLCVDTLLNFSSSLSLKSGVRSVLAKTVNSRQKVYIYYTNNTIIRYSNQLVAQHSMVLNGSVLSSFETSNIDYPTYYGVVEGGSQILLINQSNSNNFSIKDWTGIVHAQLLTFSTINGYIIYGFIVWRADEVFRQQIWLPTYNLVNDRKNFTQSSTFYPAANYVLKVLRVNTPTNYYFVTFTSGKEVYFLSYLKGSIGQATTFTNVRHDRVFQTWKISNLSIISHVIDKDQIVIIQFSDYSLCAFYMENGTEVKISQNLNDLIGNSLLKTVSPKILNDGERAFVFNDKSVRVNLLNNQYTLLEVSHDAYRIRNWTGLAILSSNFSFVYRKYDSKIYSLCYTLDQNVSLSSCQSQIISCMVQNCNQCNSNWTGCITCEDGYKLYEQECYTIKNCSVKDCLICQQSQTCVLCQDNLRYNSSSNTCDIIPSPTDTSTSGNKTPIYNSDQIKNNILNNNFSFINNIDNDTKEKFFANFTQPMIDLAWRIIPEQDLNITKKFVSAFYTPATRTGIQFFLPLFALLDDYWYYIYHEDNYTELQIIPYFLSLMNQCNQDRIIPDYLRFNYPSFLRNNPLKKSNYTLYTPLTILQIDNQETYFYQNIKPMLFQQYFIDIISIIAFKILFLVLKQFYSSRLKVLNLTSKTDLGNIYRSKRQTSDQNLPQNSQHQSCSIKNICLKAIFFVLCYLNKLVSLKSILKLFIGSNLMFITFYFSTQLRLLSSFSAFDKFSFGLAICFGIVSITYFSIYLIYQDIFSTKDSKYYAQEKRTCIQDTYLINIKCILYGFVHGFFIKSLMVQYVLLIGIKLMLIGSICFKKKIVQKKSIKILLVTYFGGGIGIDIFCILSKTQSLPSIFYETVTRSIKVVGILQIVLVSFILIPICLQICIQIFQKPFQRLFCNLKVTDMDIQTKKQIKLKSIGHKNSLTIDHQPTFHNLNSKRSFKKLRQKTIKKIHLKQESNLNIQFKFENHHGNNQNKKTTNFAKKAKTQIKFKLEDELEQNIEPQILYQNIKPSKMVSARQTQQGLSDISRNQKPYSNIKIERTISHKAQTIRFKQIQQKRNKQQVQSFIMSTKWPSS